MDVIANGKNDLNLVERLSKIRAKVDVVKKSKQGYNYTYSDIVEILAKIKAGMKDQNISLQPRIVPGTTVLTPVVSEKNKASKTGNMYVDKKVEILVQADMVFTWVCDDNPDNRLEVPWTVIGMQEDPSQAFGSGLTYCERYFLTTYFQIAQDNDVDRFRSMQKETEKEDAKLEAAEIMSEFDTTMRAFLAGNDERRADVKSFIGKYIKDPTKFMAIKEPILAGQLLKGFKEEFIDSKSKKEGK